MAEFERLILAANRNRDGGQLPISGNSARFSELRDFFNRISVILMLESAARLSAVYGVALPGRLEPYRAYKHDRPPDGRV